MTTLLLVVIYFIFISLGLPDAMLGSAWPMMYPQFGVPVSYAGGISMIIALGTVVSALQSDRLTKKLGPGVVTACSVGITCIALFGFSTCSSYWMLCLWAIPYGLGAGSVDASINNYVAIHYESWHMSWLHCMWGLGATLGPLIMGWVLAGGRTWNSGYRTVSVIQVVLTAIIVFSLPLWKNRGNQTVTEDTKESTKALSIKEVLSIPGAKELLTMFFCYCALEQTAMLWGSSYLVLAKGVAPERAVNFASMFCIGITIGRGVCGFITMKLDDTKMIRLGQAIIGVAIALLLFSGNSELLSVIGLIMVGVGCAPIYPCTIHSTPAHFGADKSQAIIGMQMAFAYVGILTMPALFGVIANTITAAIFPVYLLLILVLMIVMHERMLKII
ncbi:MAG: MFS transporter [Muricoprocola sp.]